VIRRDYILRMIEQLVQALARLRQLQREHQHQAAAAVLDEQFQTLLHADAAAVAQLSETDLLAKLIRDEPTPVVRDKCFMLVTLLHEAADLYASQRRENESRACRLQALHLLLEVLAREEPAALPEFVPKLEVLVTSLGDEPLPPRTLLTLGRHYELIGDFAKAEDALFALLEAEADNAALLELGVAFYERLSRRSDAELVLGNLPREEIQSGLAELRARRAAASVVVPGHSAPLD
jgi:hypothetical protein